MNRITIVGRTTKDPELKKVNDEVSVTSFTVAVNRPFKNQKGEQEADFLPVQVWRKQAENVVKYVKKGNLIGVDGRLQSRSYEQDGKRRFITEVVADSVQFLETKKGNQENSSNDQGNYKNQKKQQDQKPQETDNSSDIDIEEDDLPF